MSAVGPKWDGSSELASFLVCFVIEMGLKPSGRLFVSSETTVFFEHDLKKGLSSFLGELGVFQGMIKYGWLHELLQLYF